MKKKRVCPSREINIKKKLKTMNKVYKFVVFGCSLLIIKLQQNESSPAIIMSLSVKMGSRDPLEGL